MCRCRVCGSVDMVRTAPECLDPNPDPSLVLLLLQFRSAFLASPSLVDRSISDSMLVHGANGTPFVPVMLGIFVSGSCLHRQIWKHAARAGLCKTYAFCLLVGCYSACTIFFACFYLFIDLCYSAVS